MYTDKINLLIKKRCHKIYMEQQFLVIYRNMEFTLMCGITMSSVNMAFLPPL